MKGNLRNPDEIEITVGKFLLKDIGTAAATEYDFGSEIVDLYEDFPELMEMKMGHLHTHHNMGVFFSGTDMKCLEDNSGAMDYFLSIIVNREGKVIAKIAFQGKIKKKISFKSVKKLFSFNSDVESRMFTYDCEIVFPDSDIQQEIKVIKKEKEKKEKEKKKNLPVVRYPQNGYQKQLEFEEFYETVEQAEERLMYEQDDFFFNVDNSDLLSDEAIKRLLCRSITVNDLESRDLDQVMASTRSKLPDGDQSVYVDAMVEHFISTVKIEYYDRQFEFVFRKSIEFLENYRYRFVGQFCYYIKHWLSKLNDGDNEYYELDSGLDRQSGSKHFASNRNFNGRENLTITEKKVQDEF